MQGVTYIHVTEPEGTECFTGRHQIKGKRTHFLPLAPTVLTSCLTLSSLASISTTSVSTSSIFALKNKSEGRLLVCPRVIRAWLKKNTSKVIYLIGRQISHALRTHEDSPQIHQQQVRIWVCLRGARQLSSTLSTVLKGTWTLQNSTDRVRGSRLPRPNSQSTPTHTHYTCVTHLGHDSKTQHFQLLHMLMPKGGVYIMTRFYI